MAGRVWGTKQKWLGNLIPVACMAPFAALGAFLMVRTHTVTVLGIGLCVLSLVVGWAAVNQFGFYGNDYLKREIQKKTLAKAGRDASMGLFVGFARPSYVGVLDAHEDLGFFFVDEDALEYLGEAHQVKLARSDVLGVRYRPNIHSTMGLGRWISIEALHKGKAIRLLIEPREARTLLGNRKRGAELRRQLEAWRKPSKPATTKREGPEPEPGAVS